MTSLVLGVRRAVDDTAAATRRSKDKKSRVTLKDWPKLRDQVLQRDHFTCHYCGFTARKFQRVHFRSGETGSMDPANLVTACIFCEQCYELENIAGMQSGLLIWLPEILQEDLNQFARLLYVVRATEGHPLHATAQRLIDQLLARRTEAKKRLGTDDPQILATTLLENTDATTYRQRAKRLEGIRLMPLSRRLVNGDAANDQFPQILSYWAADEGPLGKDTPDTWLTLAETINLK